MSVLEVDSQTVFTGVSLGDEEDFTRHWGIKCTPETFLDMIPGPSLRAVHSSCNFGPADRFVRSFKK